MRSKLYLNKKNISLVAATIVAFAAISIVLTTSAMATGAPSYTVVASSPAPTVTDQNNGGRMLSFSLTTNGDVPQNAIGNYLDGKIFGYAWLGNPMVNDGPILFTATTIHRDTHVIDSTQNPNGWHVHTGTLTATDQCAIDNSLGGLHLAVSSITDPTGAGISLSGSNVKISIAERDSTVNPENFNGGAVGFALQPNNGALCVVTPPDA
jgi:hypothetical protein